MPTTRSANKQARLEGFEEGPESTKPAATRKAKSTSKAKQSNKRKASSAAKDEKSNAVKKLKSDTDVKSEEEAIVINRAPVLQLWGAVVAQFLYPDLGWTTCLSIGNSISTLCAISKGRSIGLIQSKEDADSSERKKKKADIGTRKLTVMGFPMQIKGEVVVVDGKPKPFKEANLKGKFGGEEKYGKAKTAFEESLQTWKGLETELDKKAFHMYEEFRPSVAGGQQGWGRKGKLELGEAQRVITKP